MKENRQEEEKKEGSGGTERGGRVLITGLIIAELYFISSLLPIKLTLYRSVFALLILANLVSLKRSQSEIVLNGL